MTQVIAMIGSNQIWCRLARGSELEIRDYCWCQGKHANKLPWSQNIAERGDFDASIGRGQGHRSDLELICDEYRNGTTLQQLALDHPVQFVRFGRGIADWTRTIATLPPMLRQPFRVLVFWGASGVGKSYRVKMDPEWSLSLYLVPSGRNPWDGYAGQTTILFDEWNSEEWPISDMNNYCDPYRLQLPCRYHNRYAEWLRVVICTNYSPSQSYAHVPNATVRSAFLRRLHDHHACRLIEKRQDEGGPSLQELIDSPPYPDL